MSNFAQVNEGVRSAETIGVWCRRIAADEWIILRDLRLGALANCPNAFGPKEWQDRLSRRDAVSIAAFLANGDAVGLISGAPYDDAIGLFAMWVTPEHRGVGIGGRLVDALVTWARKMGHQRILLDVGDHNLSAIALYESRGFVETGIKGTLPPPRDPITEHQRALLLR